MINNTKCLVCKSEMVDFFVRKNGYDLWRCGKCGFIFVSPLESEPTIKKEKNSANENWEAPKETFFKYLDILEKFRPGKGRLFDVGAATGCFVGMAQERGWEASGIELPSHGPGIEKNKNVIDGDFEEYEGRDACFDVVTFWDVLEHFASPEKAVQSASRILKPGGILAINTPDTASVPARILGKRWHLLVPPSHLHYFNARNAASFLKQYGFEVVHIGRIGKKFSLRNIFRVLALWQKLVLWKGIYEYLKKSRLGGIKISINTRDNMFIIAKKIN